MYISRKVILVSIDTYLTTHCWRTIIVRGVLRSIRRVSLVPYNIAHLNLVVCILLEWSSATMALTKFLWVWMMWWILFALFKHLLTMVSMTLSTHYPLMTWALPLSFNLCIFATLMNNRLRLDSICVHTNKATRTLKTITKLWVLHWVGIKCLLIHRSTRSVNNTLGSIYIARTVLYKHTSSTSNIVWLSIFPVGRLSAINVHIILRSLDVLKSILVWVIVHYWVICWLVSTSWFAWFLWSSPWLSSWVWGWIIDDVLLLLHAMYDRIICWIVGLRASLRYYSSSMRTWVYLVVLWSFHLYLLKLLMQLKLLLMLRIRREASPVINMTSTRYASLTSLDCRLLLLELLIDLLRVALMAWNVNTFWIITLDQDVLVWVRVFSRKEPSLRLTLSALFNHSFLRSWTLTLSYMSNCFKVANHIMKSLILLNWALRVLLLRQSLFKL